MRFIFQHNFSYMYYFVCCLLLQESVFCLYCLPVYDILMAVTAIPESFRCLHWRNLNEPSLRSSLVSFWRTCRAYGPATPSTPISSVMFSISTLYLPLITFSSIHLHIKENIDAKFVCEKYLDKI